MLNIQPNLLCLVDAAGFLTLFYLKTPAQNHYETQKEQPETCITEFFPQIQRIIKLCDNGSVLGR